MPLQGHWRTFYKWQLPHSKPTFLSLLCLKLGSDGKCGLIKTHKSGICFASTFHFWNIHLHMVSAHSKPYAYSLRPPIGDCKKAMAALTKILTHFPFSSFQIYSWEQITACVQNCMNSCKPYCIHCWHAIFCVESVKMIIKKVMHPPSLQATNLMDGGDRQDT